MTYTYIINIEFSHMMNDYMVHMVYTSFVFICMYIYVAEHRRPRSPMCTDIYTAEWSTATLVTPPFLVA